MRKEKQFLPDLKDGVSLRCVMRWARDKGILMKDNSPYQRYVNNGYIKPVEFYSQKYATDCYTIYVRSMITQRGLVKIGKMLMRDGYKINTSSKR